MTAPACRRCHGEGAVDDDETGGFRACPGCWGSGDAPEPRPLSEKPGPIGRMAALRESVRRSLVRLPSGGSTHTRDYLAGMEDALTLAIDVEQAAVDARLAGLARRLEEARLKEEAR